MTFHDLVSTLGEGSPLTATNRYGEAVGSYHLIVAADEVRAGREISAEHYSPFPHFVRKLRYTDDELRAESALDGILTLLLARGLTTSRRFTVSLLEDGASQGPWIEVDSTDEAVQVTVSSNLGMLEKKETLYEAILSLFEWTSLPVDILPIRLYRKVWAAPVDYVDVAAATSLIVLHALQCLRVPALMVATTLGNDPFFFRIPRGWSIETGIPDLTLVSRLSGETRRAGMIPHPARTDPRDDSLTALMNAEKGKQVAEAQDDLSGLDILGDVMARLERRRGYELEMTRLVRLIQHTLIGEFPYSPSDDDD